MGMKNIYKLLGLLIIVVNMSSCESNDDLKYDAAVESGWVQFLEDSDSTVGMFQDASADIDLEVNIQVPTTTSDLTIYYDMVVVSGDDPSLYFSNDGALVVPAGSTSHGGPDNGTGIDYNYLATLSFKSAEIASAVLTEPMIFDVVLTGTSSGSITAGITEVPEYPTTTRIIINPSLDAFVGTFDVAEQFISGVNAPLGLSDFFGESYQVELARAPLDDTASKFIITNTVGFNNYFVEGTVLTFGLDGSLSYDDGFSEDGFPTVAEFEVITIESSSYDYDLIEAVTTGQLGTFGEYQVTITKQ